MPLLRSQVLGLQQGLVRVKMDSFSSYIQTFLGKIYSTLFDHSSNASIVHYIQIRRGIAWQWPSPFHLRKYSTPNNLTCLVLHWY